MGRMFDYGKKGEFFCLLIIFTLGLSLLVSKHVCYFRDRKMNSICENKPSGGEERSKYVKSCQRLFLFSIALILHFHLLLFDVLA
jgi:hypothetical protein